MRIKASKFNLFTESPKMMSEKNQQIMILFIDALISPVQALPEASNSLMLMDYSFYLKFDQ